MASRIIISVLLSASIILLKTANPEEITTTEDSVTTLLPELIKVDNLQPAIRVNDVKCETTHYEIKKKVCVIGAGPAGLTTARHLSESLDMFEVIVFEQNSDVGGTWVYTDETGTNKYGYPVHSSMYQGLRTNTPREYTMFPDYLELDAPSWSFLSQAVVLDYLRNYTNHFDLKRFIQFNTRVLSVKLNASESSVEKWKVQLKHLEANKTEEIICDYVIVCSGHVSAPKIPKIPGIEIFKGLNIHSHSYRKPEHFAGKKVVVLGAGNSGKDISKKLSRTSDKVYLSQRGNITNPFLDSHNMTDIAVTMVKGIERFENGKFVLQDNSTLEVDAIIFCTGYNFEFPFLDESSGIKVDNNYVSPLYKHIVNVNHTSMNFVGIPVNVGTFPMVHVQSQYVASILNCSARLPRPSREVMMEDAKLKVENKRKAHMLAQNQSVYSDELAAEGGFNKIPEYYWTGGLRNITFDQFAQWLSQNITMKQ